VVGRASDQAVACIRDRLHRPHSAREILAAAAAQPRQPIALAVLLEREQVAPLRIGLELVETGNGPCAVPECRMRGDVVDPLRADIDDAPVAHALEFFLAVDQHCGPDCLQTLV